MATSWCAGDGCGRRSWWESAEFAARHRIGLGLAFMSWVSVVLSTIPFLAAAAYRIHVEEAALRRRFGAAYSDYAAHTRRLIPWVY